MFCLEFFSTNKYLYCTTTPEMVFSRGGVIPTKATACALTPSQSVGIRCYSFFFPPHVKERPPLLTCFSPPPQTRYVVSVLIYSGEVVFSPLRASNVKSICVTSAKLLTRRFISETKDRTVTKMKSIINLIQNGHTRPDYLFNRFF